MDYKGFYDSPDYDTSIRDALANIVRGLKKPENWQAVQQGVQNVANVAPSVGESLARGAIAQVPGTFGDVSATARQFAPQTMQNVFGQRSMPTTEEILAQVPRLTPTYQGSQQHETVGSVTGPALAKLLKMGAQATKGMPVGNMIKKVDEVPQSIAETKINEPLTRKDVLEQQFDYRGSHTAPNAKDYGGTLDNLGAIMPEDVYSSKGIRLYGIGDPKIDAEWFKAVYSAKGNPDKLVEVYRAVPKGVKNINNGDWVTTSKTYANNHGENALNGDYEIVTKKVKASTLSSEGYPYEFGYHE